jgi:hypothetical protein
VLILGNTPYILSPENRDDTHHLCSPDSFAQTSLAFLGKAGNITREYPAHVCDEIGHDGRIEGLVKRIDVLEIERVEFTGVLFRGTDGSTRSWR